MDENKPFMSELRRILKLMPMGERILFIVLLPALLVAYGISWLWDWYEHG